ncbi:TraB/GumN family protein [Maribacter hydrothermalis]|uniref:Erythromycin esterase n=1 Tax=Maribacter hydrothermalis TaxID=1836467 RepID=A0A1B7Z7Z5_9FLAO|nr:hypothetical protein [Maribacter hydrothermalis]APQ19174.1 hypothetical protein BTR34_18415 [Maribacter hydrothermalis]OBR38815.1 hypothetical protein A9200_03870 [Maribacter hydrothermalis]
MRNLFITILTIISFSANSQNKQEYLRNNRFDLFTAEFQFPEKDFSIIGFGAYHGSAKIEDAEITLLKSLNYSQSIKYYLPETDYSIAHYFNTYLKTGDTLLLKDLVTISGIRVPQERTIEVYNKWKRLKKLNDDLPKKNKLTIVGIDIQVNYKYVSKHILELLKESKNERPAIKEIRQMVNSDTTSYSLGNLSYAHKILKFFVKDYETNKVEYQKFIRNEIELIHIIKNLKISFDFSNEYRNRDNVMYENYLALDSIYNFRNNAQFLRMGFSHIEKSREGPNGYAYFFTRLIENKIFERNKVLTIIGYYTNSEVLWDELYDDAGNYTGYTVEGGFGIGDYEKEFFRGIQDLKDTKISDRTLFKLNNIKSPYTINEPDLIEVIMEGEKSNGDAVKEMSTLDFLDYALLLSNSKASTPIYELK